MENGVAYSELESRIAVLEERARQGEKNEEKTEEALAEIGKKCDNLLLELEKTRRWLLMAVGAAAAGGGTVSLTSFFGG